MAELLLLQPSASSEEEQSRKTIRARKEATDPPAVVRFPNARFSLVQWHREEAELEMLVNLSRELSSIVEAYPGSGSGTVTATTTLVALSCGPVAPSQPSAGSCALLTFFIKGHAEGAESAGDADNVGNAAVSRAGHKVKELFGSRLRGGGKGRWQGKLADGRWQKEDAQMVAEILEKSVEQV